MSYHDPHHTGKIVATTRVNSGRVAQLVSRYPGVTQNEAREIATFLRTDRQLLASDARSGSKPDSLVEKYRTKSSANWRNDSIAIAAAFGVMLITAWLIWGALAEAVLAVAETA
jgi:hypothetical protein